MSDYSAVNPPTEKNQSQAFAAALQRAKEVRTHHAMRTRRRFAFGISDFGDGRTSDRRRRARHAGHAVVGAPWTRATRGDVVSHAYS